jgi:hypothetical protein
MLSGALTSLCAVMLFGCQVTAWLNTGEWTTYRLSSAIENTKGAQDTTYVTASIGKTDMTITQQVIDWLLGIPAIVPLLIALALHVALYIYLTKMEDEEPNYPPN